MRAIAICVAAGLMLTGPQAHATAISAVDVLQEYNLIVLGDALVSTETEGPVYVGGNLTGSGPYGVNPDGLPNGSLGGTLVVGGDVNGEVRLFSGDAVVGGSINTPIFNNGGGTITQGATVDTAGVAAAFNTLSGALSQLTDTGGSITGGQNAVFNSVAGLDGVAVFNVADSFFDSISNLTFNTGDLTTIVNVSGTDIDLSGGFNFNSGSFTSDVIFNFFEAETLVISTAFSAGILAPLAEGEINGGRTEGSVVLGSLVQSVEVDGPLFDGPLPPPPTELAAPGPFLLVLLGLAGLIGFGRAGNGSRRPV